MLLILIAQIDVPAINWWFKRSISKTNATIKQNHLVINDLGQQDLDNFECHSEYSSIRLNKRLVLSKEEFMFRRWQLNQGFTPQITIVNKRVDFKLGDSILLKCGNLGK